MSETVYDTKPVRGANAAGSQAAGKDTPLRVLAAIDGSEGANGVVEFVVSLSKRGAAIEVLVLNVQSKRTDRLRGYQSFLEHEIDERLIDEVGRPIVDSVSRRLTKTGIRNEAKVDIGEPVDTILRWASQYHCDVIVVGSVKPGRFRRWLAKEAGVTFGSVGPGLAALAPIPVVVAG